MLTITRRFMSHKLLAVTLAALTLGWGQTTYAAKNHSSKSASNPNSIVLKSSGTKAYECSDGTKVKASYYNDSKGDISVAKVNIGDEAYYLPQVMSGSGARYSDMNRIEWFTNGSEEALLTQDISNKSTPALQCMTVSKTSKTAHKNDKKTKK